MKFSTSTFQPASRNGARSNCGTDAQRVAPRTLSARSASAPIIAIGCSESGIITRSPSSTIAAASSADPILRAYGCVWLMAMRGRGAWRACS